MSKPHCIAAKSLAVSKSGKAHIFSVLNNCHKIFQWAIAMSFDPDAIIITHCRQKENCYDHTHCVRQAKCHTLVFS